MFLVVSYWEAMPGKEEEFEAMGPVMHDVLRRQPGVTFAEGFQSEDGKYVVVHGYESEEAYQAVVSNPDSEFGRAYVENGVEELGRWLASERGETLPHA